MSVMLSVAAPMVVLPPSATVALLSVMTWNTSLTAVTLVPSVASATARSVAPLLAAAVWRLAGSVV